MTEAHANLNENGSLLRVARPRECNNATNGGISEPPRNSHATAAQQTGLKALALLALARNTPRISCATHSEIDRKSTQQPEVSESAFVACVAKPRDATTQHAIRARLLSLTDAEGIDCNLIANLADADIAECAGLSKAALTGYVYMLHDSALRETGKRPADETAPAMCRHCGPTWIAPMVAHVAPMVDSWPRVVGCAWCHVRNRQAMTRPKVRCTDCRHFTRDTVNPSGGAGHCGAGQMPRYPYPRIERQCGVFEPDGAA